MPKIFKAVFIGLRHLELKELDTLAVEQTLEFVLIAKVTLADQAVIELFSP